MSSTKTTCSWRSRGEQTCRGRRLFGAYRSATHAAFPTRAAASRLWERRPGTRVSASAGHDNLGQAGILLASLAGDVHLDERISGTEALENAPALVLLGADEPVTIRAIAGQRDQDPSRQEAPVDDREGVGGHRGPQVHGVGDLA